MELHVQESLAAREFKSPSSIVLMIIWTEVWDLICNDITNDKKVFGTDIIAGRGTAFLNL